MAILTTAASIWASLKGLGSLASFGLKWVTMRKNKDLMDAGAAKERERAKDEALKSIKRAIRARRSDDDSVQRYDRDPDDK